MEGDKFLMAAGVTAAVVVGAFVFWGPSGASRLRQRRGQIAGLHNFGRTCFLNALLQALSACPQFIGWLQLSNANDKKSLVSSLLSTLEVINGTHPSLRGDPHSPGSVIRALTALGWVIPPDEHDVHELLHVMLSSLEEEMVKPKKVGCLSDALGQQLHVDIPQARPSSAMLSDFDNPEYNEMANLMRHTRSEAHTPDSPHSTCTDIDDSADTSLLDEQLASPSMNYRMTRVGSSAHEGALGGSLSKRISMSYRSLDRLNRGPGRVSVWSDRTSIQVPHPFRGALSSQMTCSGCGFKSVVRYDKFDSVTLPLPEVRNPGLSLGHLLSEFIAPETLNDVTCESCNETTVHTKTLTFAKLPACLCVHISRCTWLQLGGQVSKRQDYVHFPESLSMAPYSFVQPGLSSQMSTPWGSTLSLLSSSFPTGGGDTPTASSTPYNFGSMFPRNLYRLLAVVVHSGEANSGHYVTYRRGALRNAHKWYFTSDTVVREVSIDEVLSVPAYLLFYDRGPQKSCH
ncbi:ubiquitin carboxyl-terminal hydrolase 30 homolog [Phlebotomus papatasi]|uniref:ubiquitin carboxyl-terminal hydrolase 30 homolog n=1 Tax=Phlebotomus papatasi TaxID=29031 RepID=UPI00248368CB|nr:ubiquitin carboxyl-terminal hydrolase 30 homolog [Phlebotomus papatasi]